MATYLLYVDESGDPGRHGSSHLILAGAALFEGKWLPLEKDLRMLIDRFFPVPPKPTEIHLAELRQGRGVFRSLTKGERTALLNEFCQVATNLIETELTCFAVIADKAHWFASNGGKTGDDLYAEMFEDLSSRFDLYLRRRYAEGAPSKGIIIADPHKASLCEALKSQQRLFQRQGHRWDALHNLIETVFFLDSHESPGLQLADLTSYAVWRLVNSNDDSIVRKISALFDREPTTSRINPGKWHGVKYMGIDTAMRTRLDAVWG
ncbi:MAG: DUF3800 domain-containing protein [Planctomycetes bacterium]|nr:DUF3800 domain-containing protein [Planctomycetota bacterium]